MAGTVDFSERDDGVVVLSMRDRDSKNAFSPALLDGLVEAYARIGDDPRYRAVVLTGFDSYFCSGGTSEALIALNEGRGTFSDVNIYGLAVDCGIPVIAAMQGHAIGGGLVMGLFCDLAVLALESIYTANFMNFGFTPGMGATYILPLKLGPVLGNEMLLTGQAYSGATLQRRGASFTIVPRQDVRSVALGLARDLAEKPRLSLVALKEHLNRDLRAALPAVIERELALHGLTMHQPDVRHRIATMYGR